MRIILFALLSMTLSSCMPGEKSSLISDDEENNLGWESTSKEFNYRQICQDVPKIWILPIVPNKRDEAINRLKNSKFVSLTKSIVYDLHSLSPPEDATIPQVLFNEAYDWLRKNPNDSSYRFCRNSSGKQCADELAISLGNRPRDSSAYLIRAIAKHEQTGFYSVSECEDGVYIHHNSLGSDIDSIKTQVIVILSRPPRDVIASAGTAL